MFNINAFVFHKTSTSSTIVASVNGVDYVFSTRDDAIAITEKETLTRYVVYINDIKLRVIVFKDGEDNFMTYGMKMWDLRDVKTGLEQEGEMSLIVDQRCD